ncbi:MAG: flagellar basal body L-ring protein FlgH [Endozoicomonas sp. (ex Botrylloides leachii)]|nr:flagellar basal body L-ring protein FlgH [Endozoicomonas sp. (ex Botrylloides leachii)]
MKYGVFFLAFLIGGCQLPQKKTSVAQPAFTTAAKNSAITPVSPVRQNQNITPTGSLFDPRYSSMMVSDRRTYRLGDILTVKLEGNTDIKMGGGSAIKKENAINIPDPTILGRASASILGGGNSLAFNIQPSREYGGATSANRTNALKGDVAVRVIEVLLNGTLRVEGEKWLTINSNRERIKISGLVRPEDVKTDNTVSSTRLAEAKVDYVALGINADTHEPGWLTKMLNSAWFPF